MFVGYSLWLHQDKSLGYSPHQSIQIPPNAHKDILKWIFDHEVIEEYDLADTPPCSYTAHLQTKKWITPACHMVMLPVIMDRFTDVTDVMVYNHIRNGLQ